MQSNLPNKPIAIKMKSILFILSILLFPVYAVSQNPGDAKTLLDKTHAAYRASEGIRLSFTTSSLDQKGAPSDTQPGEAYIKGDKFKLEMEAMDAWFDGKTQWVYIKEVNEVNISQPTDQEVASISPMALLSMYKSGYTLREPVSDTVNGKNAYRIEMVPDSTPRDFQSIVVSIDKTSHQLLRVVLTFNNGQKTRIDITKYNANYKFLDNEFTFDSNAYPGVEIVDLR